MQKFLISSISLLFLIFLSYKFYYVDKKMNTRKIFIIKKVKRLYLYLMMKLKQKFGKTFALTNLLSKDKMLIEALIRKDNFLY